MRTMRNATLLLVGLHTLLFAQNPLSEEELSSATLNIEIEAKSVLNQKPLWEKWCAQQSTPISSTLPQKELPPSSNEGSPFFDVSFLIWQSKMWGMEFAAKSTIPTNEGTSVVSLNEKISVPDFAWRPGVKFDVGYQFAFDNWDVDGRWTWYRGETTHLKKHIDLQTNPTGLGVVPLWFYPFYTVLSPSVIRYFEATSSWRHYFNSLDLEIGRFSAISTKTDLHLFAGVKGAWMHQYYRVEYENGSTIEAIFPGQSGTTPYTLLQSTVVFDNKTWGGGPRAGFDSRWKLGYGIAVDINGAFSLLYSGAKTTRNQRDLNLQTDIDEETTFHVKLETDSKQLKPVLEMQLGADWKYEFSQLSQVGLAILYELQYWWGQNNIRRGYSHVLPGGTFPSRGDLQMHGLTATAS